MRICFRADANLDIGVGHVMRCATLASEFKNRGHEVCLVTSKSEIRWLENALLEFPGEVILCQFADLSEKLIMGFIPDLVVVDTYEIDAELINSLDARCPVVAFVDGDERNLKTSIIIDNNLGAENQPTTQNKLAGASFCLVREDVTSYISSKTETNFSLVPKILILLGGSDSRGLLSKTLSYIDSIDLQFELIAIEHENQPFQLETKHKLNLIPPSEKIGGIYSSADIIISAAGTSAWEICTLGIPSVFLALVDNQLPVISGIEAFRCGFVIDARYELDGVAVSLISAISELLRESTTRNEIIRNCRSIFDGKGAQRTVDQISHILELNNLNQN